MIHCTVHILVPEDDDTFMLGIKRTLPFFFVPRVGETIWLGEHIGLEIANVAHAFLEDEPPETELQCEMSRECFMRNAQFLKDWGFAMPEVSK